jgi:hypothetical protein
MNPDEQLLIVVLSAIRKAVATSLKVINGEEEQHCVFVSATLLKLVHG